MLFPEDPVFQHGSDAKLSAGYNLSTYQHPSAWEIINSDRGGGGRQGGSSDWERELCCGGTAGTVFLLLWVCSTLPWLRSPVSPAGWLCLARGTHLAEGLAENQQLLQLW